MPKKIINFAPDFGVVAFQLVCADCCNPLKIKWDRSGLAFVEGCDCVSQDAVKDKEGEIRAELEEKLDEFYLIVRNEPRFHRN